MIGKLIVHGPDRETAIARMRVACEMASEILRLAGDAGLAVVERRIRAVILDVTGVSTAHAQFAGSLLRITSAVRLVGATLVITGVTPPIAQTLAGLGVEGFNC